MSGATRRGLLAGIGASAIPGDIEGVYQGLCEITHNSPALHPDAELLAVCAELRAQQAEWHRLHDLTPDDGPNTPADQALADYAAAVWPGFNVVNSSLPGRLLELRATTATGLRAKAAAVLALEAVPGLDLRDDSWELACSVLRDAAALPDAADGPPRLHTPLHRPRREPGRCDPRRAVPGTRETARRARQRPPAPDPEQVGRHHVQG